MWFMIFCAWAIKSGGCITPVQMPSKHACEFALRHQRATALGLRDHVEGMAVSGRCISVKS